MATLTSNISKTLLEITGEPIPDMAVLALARDAVEHRIEKIDPAIRALEAKYHMLGFFC